MSCFCRWDREKYPERTVEDLKERYYGIANKLAKVNALEMCLIFILPLY